MNRKWDYLRLTIHFLKDISHELTRHFKKFQYFHTIFGLREVYWIIKEAVIIFFSLQYYLKNKDEFKNNIYCTYHFCFHFSATKYFSLPF